MAKKLVIVESPAKAKTIKKYLGSTYEVVASMGHVMDLPKSTIGINFENNFEPKYINIRKQSDVIKKLKASAKGKEKIYLATDPDREGEAISWHLAHLLKIDLSEKNRVTFNEITKTGVKSGMKEPRTVDIDLVNSQQARRILDRIVGYKLSPFLWKKVKSGLSAGRVQSVTVKLIVDREEEINAFVPTEYWSIEAMLKAEKSKFSAKLYGKDDVKLEIENKQQADKILDDIKNNDFVVRQIKKAVRQKSPAPPFTTSTLQQEASRRLGFQARRTMKAAQELYEGVDVEGIGAVGLITYMRTDSLRISDEAREIAYEYIKNQYGEEYIPQTPKVYKTKGNAQDAHEAVRPTMPNITPLSIKDSLTWERFTASQMANALLDTVSATIDCLNYNFKASGYTVRFDGFTALYEETKDDENDENTKIPTLEENQKLGLEKIDGLQHFTQPPPRYTEASLIKIMEEKGIGRPSTYAPTITTILGRNYVQRDGKQLVPTELGEITTKLMKENFNNIVDANFTAKMEEDLDVIEDGKIQWQDVIGEFYNGFEKDLEKAEINTEGISYKVPDEPTDVICDKCGRNMVIKSGRFGKFLACPGFPECKNTKRILTETGGICPLCGGKILEKKSKKGKKFYGCEKNPECTFLSWDAPTGENCPKCGKSLLKKTGRAPKIYCSNENCDFTKEVEKGK
ncbi:MAG: type I DNA topoisomerase [Oscillospiraceae bacterium]